MRIKTESMTLFERVLHRLKDGGRFSASHLGITFYKEQDIIPVTCSVKSDGDIALHLQEWAKKSVHQHSSVISFKVEGDHVKIYY